MAQKSLIGLLFIALLPPFVSAKKSSTPPLEAYLRPPYSALKFGDFPLLVPNQEEIPILAPGQTVAFYLTRDGDVRTARCSEETVQPVYQAEHQSTVASFELESLVEPGVYQSDIEESRTSSGFEAAKVGATIEGEHSESEDAVAKSTSKVAAVELSTNLGEENVSVAALAVQRDDNFGTAQGEVLVSDASDLQSSIASESDNETLSQDESEKNLLRTQAGSFQRGAAASSSGQETERAKQLTLATSKRGGISGLLDFSDLSSIWDFDIGYGLLDESDELNSFEFSDDLLGIFRDASQEFGDLLERWDTLTMSDLLNGLVSEKIRREAPLDGPEPVYDVELRCSTKNVNNGNKIYFGSLFGMHTELINKGSPVYEVLILSSPPQDASFFATPEESVGYVTEYKEQNNLVVTRVFHAIESGWTFRSLYATKARPWLTSASN
jgi:hypothetical protein